MSYSRSHSWKLDTKSGVRELAEKIDPFLLSNVLLVVVSQIMVLLLSITH